MARRAWSETNKDTLVRLVRGFASSYQFMNDAKNHDEILNIVKQSLKIPDESARQICAPYAEPARNVLPRRGELDLKAFDRVLGLMGEAGVIPTPVAPAARFVDLQFLKAAGIQ
jgi:ABC-type nitrate/sulfonate/bicarbonate transport system substrate-binding protein